MQIHATIDPSSDPWAICTAYEPNIRNDQKAVDHFFVDFMIPIFSFVEPRDIGVGYEHSVLLLSQGFGTRSPKYYWAKNIKLFFLNAVLMNLLCWKH